MLNLTQTIASLQETILADRLFVRQHLNLMPEFQQIG